MSATDCRKSTEESIGLVGIPCLKPSLTSEENPPGASVPAVSEIEILEHTIRAPYANFITFDADQ
jgi:hypothetical protein